MLRAALAAVQSQAGEQAEIRKDFDGHTGECRKAIDMPKSSSLDGVVDAHIAKTQIQLNAYAASATEVVELAAEKPAAAQARMGAFSDVLKALETEMATLSEQIEAAAAHTQAEGADETGQLLAALQRTSGDLGTIVRQVRESATRSPAARRRSPAATPT